MKQDLYTPVRPGWPEIKAVKISIGELMGLAKALIGDDGYPLNIEYGRALAELITDAAGISMAYKMDMAREIGIKTDFDSNLEVEVLVAAEVKRRMKQYGNLMKGARPRFGDLGSRPLVT